MLVVVLVVVVVVVDVLVVAVVVVDVDVVVDPGAMLEAGTVTSGSSASSIVDVPHPAAIRHATGSSQRTDTPQR